MIIARAPYRISFFGGGTDYPQWYLQEGGQVLSTTIDKYCYISCRYLPPFFDVKHRIIWSKIEAVNHYNESAHPVIRAGLEYLGFDNSRGFDIHHQGDLPARTGMASSSAFTVAFLKAFSALQGKIIDKEQLALKAIDLEQNILKENVGSQDQIATAYGGFNRVHFQKNGQIRVEPVTVPASRIMNLESHLMLFYTGICRTASEIASSVIANIPNKTRVLREMEAMVDVALGVVAGQGSLDDFGHLLHESWMLKRELSPVVSSSAVEAIYSTARAHGALGGKLLGAGNSGFMVFYVPIERQAAVRQALSHLLYVPFRFENQGCSLVFYGGDHSEQYQPAPMPAHFSPDLLAGNSPTVPSQIQ